SSGDPSWVTDSAVLGYTEGAADDLDATLKSYLTMASSRERDRLQPHLGEISCPVRLELGTSRHGGAVGSDEVGELRQALRTFAVDTVAGAGHYLQEERPDAVMRAFAAVRADARSY